MMHQSFLMLLLIIAFGPFTYSQDIIQDLSKTPEYKRNLNAGDDSLRFYSIAGLAKNYLNVNIDSSDYYIGLLQSELKGENSVNSDRRLAAYYGLKGNYYHKKFQIDSAVKNYQKALVYYEKSGDLTTLLEAKYLYNLGFVYLLAGNDSSLNYLQKGKELLEEKEPNETQIYGSIISYIGFYYGQREQNELALEYLNKGYDLLNEANFNVSLQISIQSYIANIFRFTDPARGMEYANRALHKALEINDNHTAGATYQVLADLSEVQDDLKGSLRFQKEALKFYSKTHNEWLAYEAKRRLSEKYGKLEYYDSALTIAKECLAFSQTGHDSNSYGDLGTDIVDVATNSFYVGNLTEAKQYLNYFEETFDLDKVESPSYLRVMLTDLYQVNKQVGNTDRALYYLEKLNESLKKKFDEDNNKIVADIQEKYESEKKEQEIASLEQEAEIQGLRTKMYLIGGVLLLLLLSGGGYFYYRQYKIKRDKASLELEQRFLRSQLNPHFIFNSIGAIQQYLLTESPEKASDYMSMFSRLMRQILENSREEFITLEEEVSMLENYMEVQKLRFQNAFDYSIELDEDLDPEYDGIPPMFAQPFIENALEHGLFKKAHNEIKIKFTKVSDKLISLEITDSGTGMIEQLIKTSDHQSLATTITNERLEKMRVTYKADLNMSSENLMNETGEVEGYRVTLSLPTKFVA